MIVLCIGLFIGLGAGVIATLIFQGGERAGRLAQHHRQLTEAWAMVREAVAETGRLEVQVKEARAQYDMLEKELVQTRDENETRWAGLARAYDLEVHKNHTIESQRVQTWKALH
jgi:chromosome segregation ATPase